MFLMKMPEIDRVHIYYCHQHAEDMRCSCCVLRNSRGSENLTIRLHLLGIHINQSFMGWKKRGEYMLFISITGTANEGRFITTLAQMGRLWRRCHGSHTDCFPQVSMLPHEGKDLYPDLLAGGLIPQATGMHAGRKGLPS